ncbi:hypothetical protein TRFO_36290 [Tritrichomonas foetus]|uniref:Uncharacterized protein n=1 Tax=Tritrichomonas foetus TaxID=1144522 RepID=A0A1J4JJT6_9EUKA|nr:hypothetical protein TRFO_36290 [Tritrichomonas foetus]|eukprot:OHS97500.1 hypothetical protein TRFO_36290 [Tritrichomonas foetus]
MENDKCTSLARFKLAQLLSFFRSSGNSNLKLTLSKSSHDIEKILEKVEDDKYSKPIKCLLSQHLNNASTNERHNARLGSMSGSISRFAVLPENRRFRFSASTIDKCSSLPLFTSVGQKSFFIFLFGLFDDFVVSYLFI